MIYRFFYFIVLNLTFYNNLVNGQNYVLPVPGDCTKYQVCDYSGCFVFNCGIGTEFNPRILVCDYPLRDRGACSFREANIGPLIPYPGRQIDTYPSNPGTTSINYPASPSYPAVQNPGYPVQAVPSSGYPASVAPSSRLPGLAIQNLVPGGSSPGYSRLPSGSGGPGLPNQLPYCIPQGNSAKR